MPHLIHAVCTAVRKKRLYTGMAQDIILRCPCQHLRKQPIATEHVKPFLKLHKDNTISLQSMDKTLYATRAIAILKTFAKMAHTQESISAYVANI